MTAVTDKLRANEWEAYEGRMKSDITSEFTFRARKRRIHVISLSSNELWTGDSRLGLSSRPNPARYVVSRKVYVNDWTFEKRTLTRLWEFTLTLRTRSRFFVPHLHKLFAVSVRALNIRKTMRNTLSLKCDHNKANHCGEKSL